jgi:hypothetical protein
MLNPGETIGIGQTALVFQVAGAPVGTPQYQPPSRQAVSYSTPAASSSTNNKVLQYVLYGCGCLILIAICVLLIITAGVFLTPELFEPIFGQVL